MNTISQCWTTATAMMIAILIIFEMIGPVVQILFGSAIFDELGQIKWCEWHIMLLKKLKAGAWAFSK